MKSSLDALAIRAEDSPSETERLAAILDGIGEIVWAVDARWRFTVFNGAAQRFFGRSRAAVQGRKLWDVFPALLGTDLETRYRRVMQERAPDHFEAVSAARPGRYLEVRAFATPEGIAVSSRDITDRRNAEAALRRSEEQLRVALSAARLGAWERDLATGVLTATDTCKANVGLPPDAPLTFEMLQAMRHPDDVERVTLAIQRAIRDKAEYDVEYRIVWPDGSVRWIMARGHAVYGDHGRPLRMVGVTLDVTDRKAAEAALREREERIRVTYEHAFAGIAETDGQGRFLRVNEQLTFISGYSRDELLAMTFLDLTHPNDRTDDMAAYRRQWSGEIDAYVVEKRYLHKQGHDVWVKVSASIVRDADGRTLYGVRVADNITERKAAERHQRLLIDELNHRVKNTLAVVRAVASQTLKDSDVPAEVRGAFEARLLALANAHDILTRENWEGADLKSLVTAALDPLERAQGPRFRIGGPALRIRPRTAVTITLALHELGTNSAKYGALSSPSGTVEVGWDILPGADGDRFRLVWQEHGGPRVKPPTRQGFGSRLIERGLAAEIQGEVRMDFDPAGLICTIESPLSSVQESSD